MSWVAEKYRLLRAAREIDASIVLTTKDGWFWHALSYVLLIVTFGAMKRRAFLENFATTLGPIQAYPKGWTAYKVELVLPHESRHVRQFRWFSCFIHPWVGLPIMAVFYLLLPLPMFFAWFRFRLELDADKEKWRAMISHGSSKASLIARAESFCETLTGGAYAWAWPKSWAIKSFLKAVDKVWEGKRS